MALGLPLVALALLAGCGPKTQNNAAPAEFTTRTSQALTTGCGNGLLEPELGETCDDGNLIAGDGCDSSCNTETGWTCVGVRPSVCTSADWSDGPASYGFAQHGRSLPPVSPFVGMDFWTDFPNNLGYPNALSLKIAGTPGTTGQVSNSSGTVLSSFTIPAGGVASVQVDVATYQVSTNNSVTNQGVHITANAQVRVIASSEMTYSTDTWGVWGTQMLGTSYIIEDAASSAFGWEVNLIGVQDGTSVVIKDTSGTTKATIALNAGQTYQFSSSSPIVGYSVTSNNPLAVIAGTACTNDVGSACDMTAEQMAPTSDWSTAYVVAPTFNDASAKANHVVVAAQDNTTVIITDSNGAQQTYTLNAGQSKMFATGTTAQLGYLVTADKPIATASNIGDPGDNWDPALVTWPPIDGWVSDATMSTSGVTLTFINFLTVITRSSATSYVTVNGAAVSGWTTIASTGYSFARVPVPAGDNVVHATNGVTFAAVASGGQSYVSYGYSSPYNIATIGGSTTCYLGTNPPDYDSNGFTGSAAADQDDKNGTDDEDALTWPTSVQKGAASVSLTIPCNENYFGSDVPSTVYGWIDFNQNGVFDPGERASAGCVDPSSLTNGSATLTWTSPTFGAGGTTLARFRICENTTDCSSPTGMVNSGEVEDHLVHIGTCGDGFTDTFEQCDDSNNANGDGCSATCTTEPGFTCSGSPSTCLLTTAPAITSPADGTLVTTSTPSFSGTCTAGSTVRVHDSAITVCTATCDGSGNFSCTASTMPDGSHNMTADQQIGSAVSVASAPVVIKIDTIVPTPPTISSPANGAITNNKKPTVSGSCEPGSTVDVSSDGSAFCSATCSFSGTYSCASATGLADGSHTLSAILTDVGGRVSAASNQPVITIDTAAPAAPAITSPTNGTDPGTASPVISGTCEAGDTVAVVENLNTTLCTAPCNGGTFSCTSTPLSIGSHTVQPRQTDPAGNQSPYGAQVTFPISKLPVFPPTFTSPTQGAVLNAVTITLSCTDGDTVAVSEGSTTICSGTCASSTFSCTPSLTDGPHSITATQDNAGSTSAPSPVRSFTVDTMPPANPTVVSPADGASTSNTQPSISGTAEAGSTVSVTEGGVVLCTTTADASGNWSCTPATPLTEGSHTLDVSAKDAAGNTSGVGHSSFTVDLTPPPAPVLSVPANGSLANNAQPTFSGSAEAGASISVSEGGTVLCTTTADASGNWTCTSTTTLADGTHTASATATDAAGNVSVASNTNTFTIDTAPPAAPTITAPAGGGYSQTGEPTFTGTAEPGATVTILDGTTPVCTVTADANGNWTCTPSSPVSEGSHTFTATATDPAGNASPASAPDTFIVDTLAPSAPVIATPANGSSLANNLVTLGGTAEPGAAIIVSQGGSTMCTATAASDGSWSCSPAAALQDGVYTISATATDAAGNTSAASTSTTFTVDTHAPAAPVVTTPATGTPVGSGTPTFGGTGEPGTTVTVLDGSTVLCTATVDASGNWSCTSTTTLTDGSHTLSVIDTDPAGNASTSTSYTVQVDTVAPAAPTIQSPSDGASVSSHKPTVSGTAEVGSTVTVSVDGTAACTATADNTGHWSCAPSADIADGTHTLSAKATDAAGNHSPAASQQLIVDSTVPSTPSITAPANGTDTHTAPTEVSGTADAGMTVTVELDGEPLCTTTADSSGHWHCSISTLGEGHHTISAVATNTAGTASTAGQTSFTLDTTSPTAPALTSPTSGGISGGSTGPFTGTGEPGAQVTVTVDGNPVCTATVDASGNWTCSSSTALPIGDHQLSVTQTDAAGNVSTATSATFEVANPDPGSLQGGGCESGGTRGAMDLALVALVLGMFARRKRRAAAALAAVGTLAGSAGIAVAETTAASPGFQTARFEPAARGSEWFSLDSLDLRGELRPTLGATVDWAYKPLVIRNNDGTERAALVKSQLMLHVGGSLVLFDRLRVDAELPVAVAQSGQSGSVDNVTYAGASKAAVGDVRVGGDVRLLGAYGEPFSLAAGVQLRLPTGNKDQYVGDGAVHVDPHLLAAGRIGIFEYAGRVGASIRSESMTVNGTSVGSELAVGLAAGLRFTDDKLLVGPELTGATAIGNGATFGASRSSPVEALLGAHYQVSDFTVGVGAGPGLTHAFGTPEARVLASFDWSPRPVAEAAHPAPPPDRDGDGIADAQDACPDTRGVGSSDAKLNGCPPPPPDRDHDGIVDAQDACPDTAGVKSDDPKANGCPAPVDTDGDGIVDADDACPSEKGIAELKGCPDKDTDGDGIPDRLDKCPTEAGSKEEGGCAPKPKQLVVVAQNKLVIHDKIYFDTGKATIQKKSFALLDQVAEVIRQHKEITKITVEGHTDSTGSPAKNLKLSEARAKSVRSYLVSKGIDAKRLDSKGYGDTKPIDSNETREGQANNRRVEFTIASDAQ